MRQRTLRLVAMLVVLAGVAAGCGGSEDEDSTSSNAAPTTTAPAVENDDAASAVEGTWQSPPLSAAAAQDVLRTADLDEWAEPWIVYEEGGLTFKLEAGQWTVEKRLGDNPPRGVDRGTFTADGDTLQYTPYAGGVNTYRWTVTANQLVLEFVSTTEPDFQGVPAEVFQRALYTVAPFERAPS